MLRLPESRAAAMRAASADAERVFNKAVPKMEAFSAAASRRGVATTSRLVPIFLGDSIPLQARQLASWPAKTTALCLHCAETCPSTPLPAVKYHDAAQNKFWVFGFFCRPCCSLAYIQEQVNTDSARCLIWTQSALRKYFGVTSCMAPAPPRAALTKFGGPMSLDEFYGEDAACTQFKALHTPPFVTFAMYAEVTRKEVGGVSAAPNTGEELLRGLRRPHVRTEPVAVQEPTGKAPLLLEYLAARGAIALSSSSQPHPASRSESASEHAALPKKATRSRAVTTKSLPPPSVATPQPHTTNGSATLTKYLMKR